jgi:hypothetical protein
MDRYSKTVLTVIAGCLLVLVGAQVDFPPKAHAAEGNQRMLELGEQGFAYYHDGKTLWFCQASYCESTTYEKAP